MKDKDSTIVYQKQVDICKRHMTPEQFGRLMFALFDDDPDVDDDIVIAYEFMALQKSVNESKYEEMCDRNKANGQKGGRPKKTQKTDRLFEKPTGFEENPNDKIREDKIREDKGMERQESVPDVPLSLVSYLNSKTGSSYTDTEQVRELIESKLSDGYSFEDLKSVIDKKSVEWSCDGKMRSYLRPSTLFGEKFEEYLNAPDPVEVEQERGTTKKFEQLQAERDKKSSELKRITNRILQIGGVNMKDNYDEYEDLKLQAAVLEQEIDSLDDRLQKRAGVVS